MRITLVGRIDTVMEYDEDTCQARFLMEYENHISWKNHMTTQFTWGIMNMTNFFSSTVLYERRKRMHGIISELSF